MARRLVEITPEMQERLRKTFAKAAKNKKQHETLRTLQETHAAALERTYADGYNAGRLYVTNTLRDVLGIDKL